MVQVRCLVLIFLSFATFGLAAAALQLSETSSDSRPFAVSLFNGIVGHEDQKAHNVLLLGRTNGEEYPPWVLALKKRPFDDFGETSDDLYLSEPKRQKTIPHPAPLRTILPSNKFPPLHPDEPKPLPGMWDGSILYKKPVASGPKVYRGEPYTKKKSKKATWPEPWSAAFGRRWRPGRKVFPLKHTKQYKGYQQKLHQVQNGGVKKLKSQRTKNLYLSKIRHTVSPKPRGPRPASGVTLEELSPRGGTFSSMKVPFKKRPRHGSSTGSTSSAHSTHGSLTSSAPSSPTSYATAFSTPLREQSQALMPYAPLRTIPPTANRPPVHPNTRPRADLLRWDKQWYDQLKEEENLHKFFEKKILASTSARFGADKGKSPSNWPVRSLNKIKSMFAGLQKGQSSKMHKKKALRLSKRSSSSVVEGQVVEVQEAALPTTSKHGEGTGTHLVRQELLPRLLSPDPPSPKDKPASSMFSPSPTPSPPRSTSAADAERLAAQLASLRHTSPPRPTSVPRLQRAAAMPQKWDASTEALLSSLGKEAPRPSSSQTASSSSRAGPKSTISGAEGERVMPTSMKDRVRQSWLARFRREKRKKKLEAETLPNRKKKGPRSGEKLFPPARPKLHKGYRNIFRSLLGGRINADFAVISLVLTIGTKGAVRLTGV
ncbi:hypothetical protein BCV69DRAFT_276748 [Microstroma glucosiphilum]|uniref:Uncharacterized protein n=1 Tax=Pseudomicrostroma glucosiphilum TaxID=1684307 RepID=A0A316UC77_9BASI|nr:hypothetical protein BCV69DRAFT_276748 [Pseudomicrostroma glucosiphilum]PWN22061.1 hypothetical protein BCV69DRAFT_276748 [Pseudomicrostroma glucosiphilum]